MKLAYKRINKIIPIFVPHEGCPNDCIFCNQIKITGVTSSVTGDDVRRIVDSYLETIRKDANIELAFFGGSFTAIDIDKQVELLKIAHEYKLKGLINDIRLSTRPDCINKEILDIHKSYGTSIIELGVQSLDPEVLEKSLRGHTRQCVYDSSRLIREYNISLGLQMMTGLPADTEEKSIITAKEFVKIRPDFVRIYPTLTIKDTGLEDLLLSGNYKAQDLEEAINTCKKLLCIFKRENIEVIRLGLQSTDDIRPGYNLLAGPYHPAFGELVQARMVRDFIENYLDENIRKIYVETDTKNISKIIGNKKTNKNYFFDKYKIELKIISKNHNNSFMNISYEDNHGNVTNKISVAYKDMIIKLYQLYQLDGGDANAFKEN